MTKSQNSVEESLRSGQNNGSPESINESKKKKEKLQL